MPIRTKRTNQQIASIVRQYDNAYGRDACLSSIVRAWLRVNNTSSRMVRQSNNVQRVIEASPADDLESHIIATALGEFSLKQAEVALESLVDAESKRSEGIVYTPNYIIDYIMRRCIEVRSATNIPHLVDPACGSGGFLVRAVPILSDYYNIPVEKVINEFICGIDVNENAIEFSRIAIEMFCMENIIKPPDNFHFLIHGDTLLTPPDTLLNLAQSDNRGFDIVVTNPPYVKLQNLHDEYRRSLYESYPEFTTGSFSMAMLFLIAGYRLLSISGILGYITQNNIYTSLSGIGVRNFLQKHKSLHTIIDFGHRKIFSDASAYTCLMFLGKTPREHLHFYRCDEPESQLPILNSADFHDIEIGQLSNDKWRLAPEHHLRNLRKLESQGTPLGQLADIKVGFATLKDSVFLIDSDPVHWDIEPGVTAPAIKIANFSDERELGENRLRVIKPYKKIGGKWVPLEEDECRQLYPNAYSYLESHKPELSKRDKGRRRPYRFFEWGRSQCMEAPGPKLLTKTFNRGPNFLLDKTDSLFCNGYSVKPREDVGLFFTPIDIRVLQRILNSWVMDYYARLTSFQIEGGYQCFQKNFIERFCIPEITSEQSNEIMLLEGTDLQKYICDLFGISGDEIMEIVPN